VRGFKVVGNFKGKKTVQKKEVTIRGWGSVVHDCRGEKLHKQRRRCSLIEFKRNVLNLKKRKALIKIWGGAVSLGARGNIA